jgi:hypothetical protein
VLDRVKGELIVIGWVVRGVWARNMRRYLVLAIRDTYLTFRCWRVWRPLSRCIVCKRAWVAANDLSAQEGMPVCDTCVEKMNKRSVTNMLQ